MSDSAAQLTAKPAACWKWLFLVWVGVGVLLVSMSSYARWRCPSLPAAYLSFQLVPIESRERTAEDERIAAFQEWVAVLRGLESCAYAYALVGVLVFYRRGCLTFLIAGLVAVWCMWAVSDAACMSL